MSNEKEIRKQAIVKLQEELRELVKLKRKEAEERFNSTEKALEIARREYEAYAKARYDLREKILQNYESERCKEAGIIESSRAP